jgi:acyl-[acyl-carrier-protein]-phospholipid O-acyltransferase/long-chain-fatty-acid--[acyl-carrier-protein] ligase
VLYRVRVIGAARVPARGGALLLANHLSSVDPWVLRMACPRPLRFPASGAEILSALGRGELVCLFPEGAVSRTGQLMAIRADFEVLARAAGVPVVPTAIDGLWGSVFSASGARGAWSLPRILPTPVCVAFGDPIEPGAARSPAVRAALLRLWSEAFGTRPALNRNLGGETVRALVRRPWRPAIIDRTSGRRVVRAAALVAAAAVLARRIRARLPGGRIGIVLPPGAGAAIANLAVVCAGRVPVNLNFTAGRASAASSISEAGITAVLTAGGVRQRFPDFPWPERTVDLRGEIAAAGGARAMLPWLAAAWLLPGAWVVRLMGVPGEGGPAEAALLFTSGSGGSPKGVVLSHRNLLANCAQISSLSILPRSSVLLGCLPVFHSFGFTFTLWYPLIRGCRLVTSPSALDTRALIDAVREEGASVLLGAPTFLRPFLKRAGPGDLGSLRLVVTGAERLPEDLRLGFLEKFGIGIIQGYGLTETSPVSNLNQPDPAAAPGEEPQEANRVGTVGRLVPGMAARVVDPETLEDVAPGGRGVLLLRGANVFSGYLGDPTPGLALRGGWFVTWDLATIDADGFVTIEGRLARFSKIAGEMVPHGAVEQAIALAYGADPAEPPVAVVTGVPDPLKGEALVVVTTLGTSADELRERLAGGGLPNLWIPRRVVRVDSIPHLASGKLDLAALRRMAGAAV